MNYFKYVLFAGMTALIACNNDDDTTDNDQQVEPKVINFEHKTTIAITGGGEGKAEISAYDSTTQSIFTINAEDNTVEVYDISTIESPLYNTTIDLTNYGSPNSISIHSGKVAIAVENENKQEAGKIVLWDIQSKTITQTYIVGALPDMVTFTPDGKKLVVACEGEPNKEYTIDPIGEVSIIELNTNTVTNLNFSNFNGLEETLEEQGFRVFGPNADLAKDVEPEYIAVSDDSKMAWVSLQENNGIARVNLETKNIEGIFPLGYKDYSQSGNEIDPSDKDETKVLANWPIYGMYQPDAITYVNINGTGYIISANEGDAREYETNDIDYFVEEERIKDIDLNPIAFPEANNYQDNANLGRLKITTELGDEDGDGVYEKLYTYGARSFSIWSEHGSLMYDSGSEIAQRTLALTPERFNDNDKRSDDKGAEPESVEVTKIGEKYVLFVGLERTDQVLVYDITNPFTPEFIQILSHEEDESPEGVLAIEASDSPTGKALVVISNEESGTVSIYENED